MFADVSQLFRASLILLALALLSWVATGATNPTVKRSGADEREHRREQEFIEQMNEVARAVVGLAAAFALVFGVWLAVGG